MLNQGDGGEWPSLKIGEDKPVRSRDQNSEHRMLVFLTVTAVL